MWRGGENPQGVVLLLENNQRQVSMDEEAEGLNLKLVISNNLGLNQMTN